MSLIDRRGAGPAGQGEAEREPAVLEPDGSRLAQLIGSDGSYPRHGQQASGGPPLTAEYGCPPMPHSSGLTS
jgi:hypothetical protein